MISSTFVRIMTVVITKKIKKKKRKDVSMSEDKAQTLIEHIGEFRKRLIITIIFFLIAFSVSLVFCADIYKNLSY